MKYPIVKAEGDRNWLKYCGFLDLSVDQFISIQESLLLQQLEKVSQCSLGRQIMGRHVPRSMAEFRRSVPLTRYADYLPALDKQDEAALPEKPCTWAHTSGGGISFRRVPITSEAQKKQLENLMAAFILSCSRAKGQSSVAEGDRVLFNVAPKPYLSGILADGASASFNMRPVLLPDDHDRMAFKEKVSLGFEKSLQTGLDILVAMTSVLVKTGDNFNQGSKPGHVLNHMKHPGKFFRLGRALLRSKLEKRSVLPKDIWSLKALIGWGMDTDAYSEKVYQYWGAYPYQIHACTEGGIMAVQSWRRRGLTFIPNSNFFEFIPEKEYNRSAEDVFYEPATVLLSDVIPGERYELVITSFYGLPFLRYRLGHLIRITDLEDREAEIKLPQMVFESRIDDLIDIAGFTRVCERSLSQSIAAAGIKCEDWLARKETLEGKPVLHIYLELSGDYTHPDLAAAIHRELALVDQGYRDLTEMMEIFPLQVTVLAPGSFQKFADARHNAGYELAQQKPRRMNASEDDILELTGQKVRWAIHI